MKPAKRDGTFLSAWSVDRQETTARLRNPDRSSIARWR